MQRQSGVSSDDATNVEQKQKERRFSTTDAILPSAVIERNLERNKAQRRLSTTAFIHKASPASSARSTGSSLRSIVKKKKPLKSANAWHEELEQLDFSLAEIQDKFVPVILAAKEKSFREYLQANAEAIEIWKKKIHNMQQSEDAIEELKIFQSKLIKISYSICSDVNSQTDPSKTELMKQVANDLLVAIITKGINGINNIIGGESDRFVSKDGKIIFIDKLRKCIATDSITGAATIIYASLNDTLVKLTKISEKIQSEKKKKGVSEAALINMDERMEIIEKYKTKISGISLSLYGIQRLYEKHAAICEIDIERTIKDIRSALVVFITQHVLRKYKLPLPTFTLPTFTFTASYKEATRPVADEVIVLARFLDSLNAVTKVNKKPLLNGENQISLGVLARYGLKTVERSASEKVMSRELGLTVRVDNGSDSSNVLSAPSPRSCVRS